MKVQLSNSAHSGTTAVHRKSCPLFPNRSTLLLFSYYSFCFWREEGHKNQTKVYLFWSFLKTWRLQTWS